ncbi:lysophospholipid acyltransferase family protein [Kribbia dieselivorans]|uniref:lysophospholipid acyltransferase family protein n=1 Tax=Kribbia dieselivorans TaxID=331526 RepID=UPI000838C819|nr:lysophospholipid acyltransferase family protein [Kribbia dieselivorans]
MSPEPSRTRLSVAEQLDAWSDVIDRRRRGDYEIDAFGYDEDFTEALWFPLFRLLYQHWFRVEVRGIENLPAEGPALVVSNHSGTIGLDALMVQLAVHDEHPRHRLLRSLGADFLFEAPLAGSIARRTGATRASKADVERLFAAGELVAVFPEGLKGIGKPFKNRYRLQRFGRGGFVSSAVAAGVPIIPCAVVGAEEAYPKLGEIPGLSKLAGVPYIPITPTFPWLGVLGIIPLPSKWIIEFGEPVRTDTMAATSSDDPAAVLEVSDHVRATIQRMLHAILRNRTSVFG